MITISEVRQQLCKYRLVDVSNETGIEKASLSRFRSGKGGLSCENIISLINYLLMKGGVF